MKNSISSVWIYIVLIKNISDDTCNVYGVKHSAWILQNLMGE